MDGASYANGDYDGGWGGSIANFSNLQVVAMSKIEKTN